MEQLIALVFLALSFNALAFFMNYNYITKKPAEDKYVDYQFDTFTDEKQTIYI